MTDLIAPPGRVGRDQARIQELGEIGQQPVLADDSLVRGVREVVRELLVQGALNGIEQFTIGGQIGLKIAVVLFTIDRGQ